MSPNQVAIAYFTVLRKELQRIFRIWSQTLLPPAITTALYFLIFGNVIGSRIGAMNGHHYTQFIAPGLIMMSIITSSYSSSVSSFFSAKFQRSIEELLVSPMPNWVIVAGYASGGMVRGLIVGFVVSLIALSFTHLHIYSWLNIIISVVLASAIFSLAGVINAIYAKKFDDISIVPTFILTPLTYLGGVFYSVSLLPKIWQYVSLANPIVYIIDNFRFGFLGIVDSHLAASYVMMVLLTCILFVLSLKLINKGTGLRD